MDTNNPRFMVHDLRLTALRFAVLLALATTGLLISCLSTNENTPPTSFASATIINTAGQPIGAADFTQESTGIVTMVISVTGLPPGQHGIHFHTLGKAEPSTAFLSSGDHVNPDNKEHGLSNPKGSHNGDLPNLLVDSKGVGTLTTATDRITLSAGTKSVFDTDGTSIIIHANADDQLTDPSGNSGGRIAAGVLTQR